MKVGCRLKCYGKYIVTASHTCQRCVAYIIGQTGPIDAGIMPAVV